jgi:hypothetical protein
LGAIEWDAWAFDTANAIIKRNDKKTLFIYNRMIKLDNFDAKIQNKS